MVSNESLELNAYRIRTFRLDRFVDSFISSCFVHLRKPDANKPTASGLYRSLCFDGILTFPAAY